jgi:hypothetical protein
MLIQPKPACINSGILPCAEAALLLAKSIMLAPSAAAAVPKIRGFPAIFLRFRLDAIIDMGGPLGVTIARMRPRAPSKRDA